MTQRTGTDFLATADAAIRASQQAWWHFEVEYTEPVEAIIGTLVEQGPWAYTIMIEPGPDGRVRQNVATTREGIRDAYETMHKDMHLARWLPVTEIASDWYTFHHGIAIVEVFATGETFESESLLLFPTLGGTGITGELFWARLHPQGPGVASDVHRRRARAERLDAALDGIRTGDADAAVALFADTAQIVHRDYVGDSGTIVSHDGAAAYGTHLRAFAECYDVRDATVVRRHVDDWYSFQEIRWTLAHRDEPGRTSACLTAEFAEFGPEDCVVATIGHGTPLEPAPGVGA